MPFNGLRTTLPSHSAAAPRVGKHGGQGAQTERREPGPKPPPRFSATGNAAPGAALEASPDPGTPGSAPRTAAAAAPSQGGTERTRRRGRGARTAGGGADGAHREPQPRGAGPAAAPAANGARPNAAGCGGRERADRPGPERLRQGLAAPAPPAPLPAPAARATCAPPPRSRARRVPRAPP